MAGAGEALGDSFLMQYLNFPAPKFRSTHVHLRITQDQALPFVDQAGILISHLVTQQLQNFSMWWYGHVGQIKSQLLVCNGLPSADVYLNRLTLDKPPEPEAQSYGLY